MYDSRQKSEKKDSAAEQNVTKYTLPKRGVFATQEASMASLLEELEVDGTWTSSPLGVLNDDTNPVGTVHVGFVQVIQLTGDARVRETDQLEGDWTSLEELARLAESDANFETWSSLLLPHISATHPDPLPTA